MPDKPSHSTTPATSSKGAGALDGLRVIDLSRILAGPWATQALADLGADVIKVESPGSGDGTRVWGPPFLPDTEAADKPADAAYYTACNRNKRSITIDFAQPEGADLVRELVRDADVLVENFKLGGLKKYGLAYDDLKALNPGLVYCSITGFGQTGPYAHRPGYDFLIQAMGGLMSVTGEPDEQPGGGPMKTGVAICDLFTGMYATVSILAALRHRDNTGQGQHIECSLLDTQVAMLANQASNYLVGGVTPGRMGNDHPNVVPYKAYASRDGHVIITCGNDGQFSRLCAVLGCSELATDSRFSTNADRILHRDALDELLNEKISQLDSSALISLLEAANVPCGPIHDVPAVFNNEQVIARELQVDMQRDDGTPVSTVAFPVRLAETPASYRIAPPSLGADTEAVLQELTGMDDERLRKLSAAGII
ncbi:MAG: CoA transferase [Gammaproteobacteria bacterium]|nr:CoA transferase [Gammaproteobacteria bacterium]